jgi:hypothetical protein
MHWGFPNKSWPGTALGPWAVNTNGAFQMHWGFPNAAVNCTGAFQMHWGFPNKSWPGIALGHSIGTHGLHEIRTQYIMCYECGLWQTPFP